MACFTVFSVLSTHSTCCKRSSLEPASSTQRECTRRCRVVLGGGGQAALGVAPHGTTIVATVPSSSVEIAQKSTIRRRAGDKTMQRAIERAARDLTPVVNVHRPHQGQSSLPIPGHGQTAEAALWA
jgi:hypothetical protein